MTVHGYPQLAQFLHLDPSFWIFRRFAALNAKNLLYMQAELVNLERELADLEEESCKSGIGAAAQYRVFELKNEMADANVRKQWEKVMEVRGVLREYNALLLQQQETLKLSGPNHGQLIGLTTWLENSAWDNQFLQGSEELVWTSYTSDLITLSVRKEEGPEGDAFTRWFTTAFDVLVMPLLHRLPWRMYKPNPNNSTLDGTTVYKDVISSTRIAEIITLILASLLPTSSIFALYYITNPVVRLTFIMLYRAVFTGCLAFFTSAKRVEIFLGDGGVGGCAGGFYWDEWSSRGGGGGRDGLRVWDGWRGG